jgi:circadian clock protein KaiC
MPAKRSSRARGPHAPKELAKSPTGIPGLDEITGGGLPAGRPTLVCGTAGSGKTLFAIEFLVRGATEYGEPGVFMAFEETAEDLAANVRSLGFDLPRLVAQHTLYVDHVEVERSEIEETGEYNLDGLFVRLANAIDTVKAKRVVLDTIESLFSGFSNTAILRAELRRLFGWLKDRGVTAVITGERGEGQLTRQGLEEYVSDCVILLDQRVVNQLATRRLRIVKYRGSAHGTNEYPFLIDEQGMSVLPITSLGLQHEASDEQISTGIPSLDAMLGGKGIYRGTSVLVSGPAGTGKTSFAMQFAVAACRRGERTLVFAYEESVSQMTRNMRSIGIELQPWLDKGLLRIHSSRPSAHGLEMHLVVLHKLVRDFRPRNVVIDPITNLTSMGTTAETNQMLVRVIDFLKAHEITGVFTSLTEAEGAPERTSVGVSSLIDTWLMLSQLESDGERNRTLFILKSRGTNHSNQVREFVLSGHGIELRDVYVGPAGVLTGSARVAQEARERDAELRAEDEAARQRKLLAARRSSLEARIAALHVKLQALAGEMSAVESADRRRIEVAEETRRSLIASRGVERPRTTRRGEPDGHAS